MSTATQVIDVPRGGAAVVVRDYAELVKARVTSLVMMTAWCGFFFGVSVQRTPGHWIGLRRNGRAQ